MPVDAIEAEVRHDGGLGNTRPNDVAISQDGSRVYAAGDDGNLRVYSADTGELLQTIDVGIRLGAIDVSPDGSFLMAVEMVELATHEVESGYPTYTVTAYRVDLATGSVTSFEYETTDYDHTFHDVAIMADGTVLFSQNIHPGWSGWATLKSLDLSTGTYTVASGTLSQSPVLSDTADGEYALIAPTNISDAPLYIYQSGVGIVATHDGYDDNVSGFNSGIQALSPEAGLVAQYLYGDGLHIYDLELNYKVNLFSTYPNWQHGNVSALAFDPSGKFLFVLDNAADTIVQLSTADWSVVDTIDAGLDLEWWTGGDYGSRLIVGPDLRYFTVVTENGIVQVDNPSVSSTISGTSGADSLTGTGLFDEMLGGDGNDTLAAGAGNDILNGGAGNDVLNGGAGRDLADYRAAPAGVTVDLSLSGSQNTGGAGTDTLISIEILFGSSHNDTLSGNSGANDLSAGTGDDTLAGRGGNDTLNGGDGNDRLEGGDGNDTASYAGAASAVAVDLTTSSGQYTGGGGTDLLLDIENLTGSDHNDRLTGNSVSNRLTGGAGNDRLDGGAGGDILVGEAGNDTYLVDHAGDLVTELANDGIDEVIATVAYTLSDNVERLTLSGANALDGTGNGLANRINGNNASNQLSGLAGNDELYGFGGNDTLDGGAGNDLLEGGAGADTATYANASAAVVVSLATVVSQNTVGAGNDTLAAIENLTGSAFADRLAGNSLSNFLVGLSGADILIGAGGVDQLDGGSDSDVYLIDAASEHGAAEISDSGGSGSDEVRFAAAGTAQTLRLYAGDTGIEKIVIGTGLGASAVTTGLLAHNVDARALTNGVAIIGNSGANTVHATAFADSLSGGNGDDRFYAYAGNDMLDGGRGLDIMYGGLGDDTYLVDHASDAPIELAGEGVDTVLASVAHTLKANVEHMQLTGIYSIHGRGNGLANILTGNAGSNRLWGEDGNDTLVGHAGNDQLDGGAGNDTLIGGIGNDIYYVGAGDLAVEAAGEGRDTVRTDIGWQLGANFEWLELGGTADVNGFGNALANVLKGNSGANSLSGFDGNDKIYGGAGEDQVDGGAGNDWLEGGAGRDTYTGGTGSDRYVFRDGDFGGATTATADVITDFGDDEGDRIRLDLVDANSTLGGNQKFAWLGDAAFTGTAGELRFEQIGGNTYVSGDTNGDGVADFMIALTGLHTLGTDDFIF